MNTKRNLRTHKPLILTQLSVGGAITAPTCVLSKNNTFLWADVAENLHVEDAESKNRSPVV